MVDLPPNTRNLLDMFHGPLRDVRFPDADADRLEAAIDAVNIAAVALAQAEAALAAAREALGEKQRLVTHETDRALAYVRVYAADRPDLRAALDAITSEPAARRGRGRPRKVRPVEEVTEAAAE